MELLRFATAGSVDDGKSTLIGRLLHDTKTLADDVIDAISASTIERGGEGLDLALITDGLRAEREQGITIDVAYRYFSTAKRSFVIADTPGHVQYTRNMVTGASTSDVAVILVDAVHGVREQSRRHACLSALLGIEHLVVAVNKMDLVGWSHERFDTITAEVALLADELGVTIQPIPLCALDGDNVVDRSANTPWYDGPTLLQHLEELPVPEAGTAQLRLPVQLVIKPAQGATGSAGKRWYAGSVASGVPVTGDEVVVLPSGTRSQIVAVEGGFPAVRVQLADELDVARGDVIASADAPPRPVSELKARVAWLNDAPLASGARVMVKHATRSVTAIAVVHDRFDVGTLSKHEQAESLQLNEIGTVTFSTSQPLPVEPYFANRTMGSFIVIDPLTNVTVGAGMVTQ